MVEPDVWRCCSRRRGSREYLGDGRSRGRDAGRAYGPPVGRSHNITPQVCSLGSLRRLSLIGQKHTQPQKVQGGRRVGARVARAGHGVVDF